MFIFLIITYTLISIGFVVGFTMDNYDIPKWVKVILLLISPIVTPLLFGASIGIFWFRSNRPKNNYETK